MIASDVPAKLWTWAWALALPTLVYRWIAPTAFGWTTMALTAISLAVAAALGLVVSLPTAWLILGPLYMEQAERNGAPFNVGDQVEILCGAHRGEITRVRKRGQIGVHLDLGVEADKAYTDIYAPSQIRRVTALT